MDIIQEIEKRFHAGYNIRKPAAKSPFTVKGWGERRGEKALIYYIPNRKNPDKPYQKGITESEWQQAYQYVVSGHDFTRQWFNEHMPECAAEGGCNFTTIGGIFEDLSLVDYQGNGIYQVW